MKKCEICGYENPDNAYYCLQCGEPLVFGTQTKDGHAAQSTQSTQITQPTQVTQSTQNAQSAQPVHATQTAQDTQVAQSTQPVQGTQTEQTAQPVQPASNVEVHVDLSGAAGTVPQRYIPPLTKTGKNLVFIAFLLNLFTAIALGFFVLPLAWQVPMTVVTWKIYKGTRELTAGFGVCVLIFLNFISGILLLCAKPSES